MNGLRLLFPLAFPLVLVVLLGRPPASLDGAPDEGVTERARKFVRGHEKRLRPLDIAANRAWWDANTTGKKEDFVRKIEAQNRVDEALSDRKAFAEVKQLRDSRRQITDPVLARAIEWRACRRRMPASLRMDPGRRFLSIWTYQSATM